MVPPWSCHTAPQITEPYLRNISAPINGQIHPAFQPGLQPWLDESIKVHPFGLLGQPKTYTSREDRCFLVEEQHLTSPAYPNPSLRRARKRTVFCDDCGVPHDKTIHILKWILLGCRMVTLEQWMGFSMFRAHYSKTRR